MSHRKLPFRPDHEISQVYPDGLVTIYRLTDSAAPGYAPKPTAAKVGILRYEERRLGLQRFYSAQQVNVQVERVLRVPRGVPAAVQDRAVTEDGQEYEISLIQAVPGIYPPSLDLTLAAVSQRRVTAEGVSDSDTGGGGLV